MSELDSVGVVSVATNQYLDYWFAMARSASMWSNASLISLRAVAICSAVLMVSM